jgi:RNA recognition motif-containing protein
MSNSKLYVGNLSFETLEIELEDLFKEAGTVTEAALMQDRMTGKSRGFAFVEFATPEEATKAVEQFHNKDFQGRALTVNVARPREERAPRFGGDRQRAGEARV